MHQLQTFRDHGLGDGGADRPDTWPPLGLAVFGPLHERKISLSLIYSVHLGASLA